MYEENYLFSLDFLNFQISMEVQFLLVIILMLWPCEIQDP